MEVYLFLNLENIHTHCPHTGLCKALTVLCGLCWQMNELEGSLQPAKLSIHIYSTYIAVLCIVTNCSK